MQGPTQGQAAQGQAQGGGAQDPGRGRRGQHAVKIGLTQNRTAASCFCCHSFGDFGKCLKLRQNVFSCLQSCKSCKRHSPKRGREGKERNSLEEEKRRKAATGGKEEERLCGSVGSLAGGGGWGGRAERQLNDKQNPFKKRREKKRGERKNQFAQEESGHSRTPRSIAFAEVDEVTRPPAARHGLWRRRGRGGGVQVRKVPRAADLQVRGPAAERAGGSA